jgi:hypothetical protein
MILPVKLQLMLLSVIQKVTKTDSIDNEIALESVFGCKDDIDVLSYNDEG